MPRRPLLIAAIGLLVLAACTDQSEPTSTTASTSTTTVAPLTTLAPQSTTTTLPPTTTTTTEPLPTNDCVVGSETDVEGYTQGCSVLGFEIRAGEDVAPEAVTAMADHVYEMLVLRPDLTAAMLEQDVGFRVIGQDQRLTSLPEYGDLYDLYPGTDWARAARAFPGTDLIPYVAGAEENLLCLADDRYEGEDNFMRDLALAIRRFGLFVADPLTSELIDQAYGTAIAQGLWVNTLAEINSDEYWAEGVQSFFDANLEEPEDRPPNSSHNHVDTRDELRLYDPTLHDLVWSVFGDNEWRPCAAAVADDG